MEIDDREYVQSLAAATVEEVAPEEMLMFSHTSDLYFEDPDRLLAAQSSKDEALGFGVDAAVALIAPIALAAAKDVIEYVYERLKERFAEETADGLMSLMKRLFEKSDEEATSDEAASSKITLDNQEIAHVRSLVVEKSTVLGLPVDRAQLLADAMAGSLVGEAV